MTGQVIEFDKKKPDIKAENRVEELPKKSKRKKNKLKELTKQLSEYGK